ncbi:MAG: PorP/SprF family type IX secretion system membrane protein [Crocinitomicaceae bacterium]|nr:PorP/SprF family type IX secretion system membrane protein [Crocinitomicaceae bacterium]
MFDHPSNLQHKNSAQQVPQYSQWFLHQFANNPAHAGIKKCVDLHTLYRIQWVGFEGAPSSGFLTASIPLNARRKRYLSARQGTGFKFETDRIGQFNVNRVNFAYAAHFNFNKYDRLSLGVYGGVLQMAYDPSASTTAVPDPSVMSQANFISPDASFGAWFNSQNYFIGLSLQNLFRSPWQDIGTDSRYRFHTAINGGYRYAINEDFTFLPMVNLKIPPSGPLALDLNLYADYKNFLGFGLGFRNTDALIAILDIKLKEQLSIGYSFDFTLSRIQSGAHNTHEISLRFTTCKPDRSGPASCPLFE